MGLMDWIPEEVKGENSRVVIVGREEMVVEQHRGLIAYETDEIRFRVKKGEVCIRGKALTIAAFGAWDARVQGTIEAVLLSEAEA